MRFIYTKAFAFFSFFLVIVSILLILEIKGFLSPVKSLILQAPRPITYIVRGLTAPLKNFFGTVFQLKKITTENSALHAKVFALQADLVQLDQTKRENEALRKELGFFNNTNVQYQACSILSQNPLGLTDTFVLGCGTEKGVTEGSAVVTQGYLIGKIIYSGRNSSTALLITNSKFSADARISKTNTNGEIKGSFGSGIFIDQLSQNDAIEQGWLVVTAGINEKIPRNILIGEIGHIMSSPNDLFKKASVLSPIDLRNLQLVFVAK